MLSSEAEPKLVTYTRCVGGRHCEEERDVTGMKVQHCRERLQGVETVLGQQQLGQDAGLEVELLQVVLQLGEDHAGGEAEGGRAGERLEDVGHQGGQGDGQALLGGHDGDVPPSDVTHQADGLLAGALREVAASRGREVREEVGGAAVWLGAVRGLEDTARHVGLGPAHQGRQGSRLAGPDGGGADHHLRDVTDIRVLLILSLHSDGHTCQHKTLKKCYYGQPIPLVIT